MLTLFVAALVMRWPSFGDRTSFPDEQFYLLVGDRLLHGQLPYVNLWDRKPIGLFLLYAGCRLLGGDGFVQYQFVAALFAGGTGCCVMALARPLAGLAGGLMAGLLYLTWLAVPEGGGGQAPVFYNLLVAAAALLILHGGRKRRLQAMALIGLAMQIKYTVVVEGLFLGLVALWEARRDHRRLPALAAEAAMLVGIALAPSLLALAAYAALGEAQAFWFANVQSIFLRGTTEPTELRARLAETTTALLPLLLCAATGTIRLIRTGDALPWRLRLFMAGWLGAALAGYLVIGVLYVHYVLPVLVPLAVLAAPASRWRPAGTALIALTAALPLWQQANGSFAETRRSGEKLAALAALVPPGARTSCLHMFGGPPALFLATQACVVSRYVFSDHLTLATERGAIGIDPIAEVRRIFAHRPLAVAMRAREVTADDREVRVAILAGLAANYRRVGVVFVDDQPIALYVRR